MKKISSTIVFFGSGPVAAKSLALLQRNFNIEAVVTKPRPPHHKGTVPVLEITQSLGLPVYSATNKTTLGSLTKTWSLSSRIAVLIDFGLLVPQELMDYFPLGIVNSHFSLLPEWRGADPITFSILSGQQTTGISLMILAANIDEGPLLAQSSSVIPATATTPSLTETLINLSDKTLASVLPNYIAGKIKPYPQTLDHPVTYSRKLYKNDGVIDWHKPAQQLEREIRAFIEWPKSQTKFGDVDITITQAHVAPYNGKPGGTAVYNKLPVVYCGEQALAIDKLKPASRSEMTGEAFLNGYGRAFKV